MHVMFAKHGYGGLGLVAAAVASMGLAACGSHHADPRSEDQLVRIIEVQPAAASDRGFTGVVAARVQSNLGFRVSGKVIERLVDVGQSVRAGQPLMRLDATDFEHAITVQVGNVAAANARQIQAAADAARYRDLVSSGAVSKSSQDQVQAAADSAQALLAAAQAQLKVAQDDATYSSLLADSDGVVVETLAEPGQVVAAGQVVIRLAHAGPREAAIDLPETLRPAIASVGQAKLYNDEARFSARLRQLSDAADPATRTYEARYVLGGSGAQAPLGATVTVYLTTAGPAGVTSVPLSALDDEGREPGVWVLETGKSEVSFRPVQIARLSQETVTLSGGVTAGERIVALGGHMLHSGQHVRIAQNTPAIQ
jgi:RND family efflux transporter MFP subunit